MQDSGPRIRQRLNLHGSICALATPFRAGAEAIDVDGFSRLVDAQADAGTQAVVVAGSTGEAAALDGVEFEQLIGLAIGRARGRMTVLAGTGQSATRHTIARTRLAAAAGAEAALVVVPPYVRATQEGLYRHFCEVADHGGLPVVLYNVPARTACDLEPATVARLRTHGNIVGIKEAVPDEARMQALLALRSPTFRILSGDDPTAMRSMLAGADGVISVAANVAPGLFAALCRACAERDAIEAAALDRRLEPLYALLAVEPNPIPVKACLAAIGFGAGDLRLPLLPLSASHRGRMADVLAALGIVQGT